MKKNLVFTDWQLKNKTFHNVVTIEQSYMFNIHFATQSGILKILTEIHFLTPTRSGILYLASPCYASLRSDSAICFALYKIPELLGVKKRISLSTKRIPLFVANDIEQSIILSQGFKNSTITDGGQFSTFHKFVIFTTKSTNARVKFLIL